MTIASDVLSEHPSSLPELRVQRPTADTLCVELGGSWTIQHKLPPLSEVQGQCGAQPVQHLTFATHDLAGWDSGLLTFLLALTEFCTQRHIKIDYAGLPQGVQRLLRLATAVPERQGARREA